MMKQSSSFVLIHDDGFALNLFTEVLLALKKIPPFLSDIIFVVTIGAFRH